MSVDIDEKEEEKCLHFFANPSIDPETKETISVEGDRYKRLAKECNIPVSVQTITDTHCKSFLADPLRNSLTGNPITSEEVQIFYQKCGFPTRVSSVEENIFQTSIIPSDKCADVFNSGDKSNELTDEPITGFQPTCITYKFTDLYWKNVRMWMASQYMYISRLSPEDKEILFSYNAGKSFDYNRVMRKDGPSVCDAKSLKEFDVSNIIHYLERLYVIIRNAPPCPRLLVFRGEHLKQNPASNYLIRTPNYENKGFVSTTLDANIAAYYASQKGKGAVKDHALLQIEIPSGTPAIFIAGQHYPALDYRVEIVFLPSLFEFKGIVEKAGGAIQTGFPPRLANNVHPGLYCFRYKQEIPLEYKLVDKKPTPSQIIEVFCSFFKDNNLNKYKEYKWAVKGGYGINKLLEIKYGMTNLIPTYDLDIGVFFLSTKFKDEQILNFIRPKVKQFIEYARQRLKLEEDELYSREHIINNVPVIAIKYRYCTNREEGIIDIGITGKADESQLPIIDKDVSSRVGVPIQTVEGYFKELKDVIIRENIKSLDPSTYRRRNLKQNEKGRKTVKRSQMLCKAEIDKVGRTPKDYETMCNMLLQLNVRTLYHSDESQLQELFTHMKDNLANEINIESEKMMHKLLFLDSIQARNYDLAYSLLDKNLVVPSPQLVIDSIDFNPHPVKVIQVLLDKGVILDTNTLNSILAKKPSKEVSEYLINKANGDELKEDLLNSAVFYKTIQDILSLLMDRGIKPNTTTLDYALEQKYPDDTIIFILDKGAIPDSRTIHRAIENKYKKETLERLIQTIDKADQRLLKTAIQNKLQPDLIKAILSKGAKPDSVTIRIASKIYNNDLLTLLESSKS